MKLNTWPLKWKDQRGQTFDVYPTVYRGVLNYGLDRKHALAGAFPTAESVDLRKSGRDAWDGISILDDPTKRKQTHDLAPSAATGGMQLSRCVATRLESGTTLYRFGDEGGYKGGWWTDRAGLFRMLLRVEPQQEGMPGVRGGSQYNIRDYARRYSEVLGEWGSRMKYLYATRLLGPVMAFRGMGAAQRSSVQEIHDEFGQPIAVTFEHMADDNRQLFIPNIFTRIDGPPAGEPRFFAAPVKWHPEVLEVNLVPQVIERLAAGERYRTLIPQVETWMMAGNRRAQLVG